MMTSIRAAIYARVSSQRQADEETIESQLHDLVQRACDDQVSISESSHYCDDGYSGSELLRPALERLRDQVAAGLVDRIYVHSPDRLARKFVHQAVLLAEFTKLNCDVVFLSHIGMPKGPETDLLVNMQGAFAEYERAKILERTRRGRRYAASIGNVSVFSGAPFGYRYINKRQGGGQARWEIDPVTSQTVRLMFQLVGDHGYSLSRVARELQHRKILTPSGKQHWCGSTIRVMLTNPAYCGRAVYGKKRWEPRNTPKRRVRRCDSEFPRQPKIQVATDAQDQITISVPAIVEESLFEKVSQRMKENRRRKRDQQQHQYLLSNLVVCGGCGSAYCGQRQRGSKHVYYRCIGRERSRLGNRRCDRSNVRAAGLESLVWSELCQVLEDPDRLATELERRRGAEVDDDVLLRRKESESKIATLDGQIERLIDVYTDGHLERREFESRIARLRQNKDLAVSSLASFQNQASTTEVNQAVASLKQLGDEVQGVLSAADEDLQRKLLKLLVDRIELHEATVRIVFKIPATQRETPICRQHCSSRHDGA